MKHIPLGATGLMVSEFCLGTMTWGSQNTESEGHDQIKMALEHGVNFWDTAEMYPTNPTRAGDRRRFDRNTAGGVDVRNDGHRAGTLQNRQ